MDDIVTRLRDYVCLGGYECLCDSCALHAEAAAEIERLRTENAAMRRQALQNMIHHSENAGIYNLH